MNVFLKKLMTLATELNDAEGFNALVVVNEMELLYDKHVTELKNLHIACVMPQSEQLKAFIRWNNKHNGIASPVPEGMADHYIKSL